MPDRGSRFTTAQAVIPSVNVAFLVVKKENSMLDYSLPANIFPELTRVYSTAAADKGEVVTVQYRRDPYQGQLYYIPAVIANIG